MLLGREKGVLHSKKYSDGKFFKGNTNAHLGYERNIDPAAVRVRQTFYLVIEQHGCSEIKYLCVVESNEKVVCGTNRVASLKRTPRGLAEGIFEGPVAS